MNTYFATESVMAWEFYELGGIQRSQLVKKTSIVVPLTNRPQFDAKVTLKLARSRRFQVLKKPPEREAGVCPQSHTLELDLPDPETNVY